MAKRSVFREMLGNLGPPTWSSPKNPHPSIHQVPIRKFASKRFNRPQYRWNNGNRLFIDACVFGKVSHHHHSGGDTVGLKFFGERSGMMGKVYHGCEKPRERQLYISPVWNDLVVRQV